MKMKNVGFFEQNVEKFLIGLTLVVLVGAVYFYVLSTPHKVKIQGEEVTTDQVDEIVLREAQLLDAAIKSKTTVTEIEQLRVPDYIGSFRRERGQALFASGQLGIAMNQQPVIAPNIDPGGRQVRTARHEPVVPPPAIIALRPDLAAIHRDEVEANPALSRIFSGGWPYDTAWVSLTGSFDMSKMLDELTKLPPEWWERDNWGFVDVMVERQVRLPDGSWSKAELVAPMPGVEAANEVRRIHEPGVLPPGDAATAQAWFEYIQKHQSVILTPVFWELANANWAPADPDDLPVNIQEEVGRVRELKTLIRQQELAVRRLNQQLQQRTQAASKIKQRVRPKVVRPGETDSDLRSGQSRPAPAGPNLAIQRLRDKLQKESESLEALRQEYLQRTGRETGGAGTGGRPAVDRPGDLPETLPPGPRRPRPPAVDRSRFPAGNRPPGAGEPGGGDRGLVEPDEAEIKRETRQRRLKKFGATDDGVIKIYANDLEARPGQTYRYRMRVAVINPLYLRLIDLPEEQKERNQDRPLLYSPWSAWSRDVTTERLNHFFVRSAQRDRTADVEVWRFYYGKWRNHEFRVVPGAPIGGPVQIQLGADAHTMNFFTDAHVVDMEVLRIPGRIRNTTRETTRVLLMHDGELMTRRLDHDRDHPKRQWLQIQQQRMGGGVALGAP